MNQNYCIVVKTSHFIPFLVKFGKQKKVLTCIFMYVYIYIYTYIIYIYIMYVYMYVCMYVCMCICVYVSNCFIVTHEQFTQLRYIDIGPTRFCTVVFEFVLIFTINFHKYFIENKFG